MKKKTFNSSAVCTVPTTAITIIENGHKLFKHFLIAHYGKVFLARKQNCALERAVL